MKEYSIFEIQSLYGNDELTCEELVEQYLQRIDAFDKNGPTLRSIIEVNSHALDIARKLDEERKNGAVRGPLHGVPILIKDNINTNDKMMTTAGSLALHGNYSTEDAFVVKQLRNAGAVIIGKTNLSEWANFRSTKPISGWSSRGGQTKNPYALNRSPGGSSSGSAVAVAANFCTAAVGTETVGSIIGPSSVNGIVGLKPTVGLLSQKGIIPISHTQDTAGPMARSVEDVAILLSTMIGLDHGDKRRHQRRDESNVKFLDYSNYCDRNRLSGARLGVYRENLDGNFRIEPLFDNCLDVLISQGAEIVEDLDFNIPQNLWEDELQVLNYEFKDGINRYLENSSNPNKVTSLNDLIQFNKDHEDKVMPYFKQEVFERSSQLGPLDDEQYTKAITIVQKVEDLITDLVSANNLDAIITVSSGYANLIDHLASDYRTSIGFGFHLAAIAGYPSITVPMGDVQGLPIGLCFFSLAYTEPDLIGLAYAFEQATKFRNPPTFPQSVNPEAF